MSAPTKLSMNVATIPPGGVAYAHIHVGFELMLYILQGRVRHEYGPGLKQSIENEAGDFIYIEPGVPHEVFNLSESEPVVAVVARSDASEWENIVPYDKTSSERVTSFGYDSLLNHDERPRMTLGCEDLPGHAAKLVVGDARPRPA